MATFVWTLPTPTAGSLAGGSAAASDFDKLFGRDIYLAINGDSGPNTAVTKHGDWVLTNGHEALIQSLTRRWITPPGDWSTKKDYGAGALSFVKASNSVRSRDELSERIRAQTLKDKRVAKVSSIEVKQTENALVLKVVVIPKGEAAKPLPIVLEVR